MNTIRKANLKDAQVLSQLSIDSFLPAHGHSAPKKDIDDYVNNHFKEASFIRELSNSKNHYYFIYHQCNIAGYSKIVFDQSNEHVKTKNIAYMSRLYLLKEYYGTGLGKHLFDFNINLCKLQHQKGIWLAVWVENNKAISFYKKMGFQKVGDYDFKISASHSNPNHILYLEF